MLLRTLVLVVLAVLSTPIGADPLEDAENAYEKKDYPAAMQLLRPLAEQGVIYAQIRLGMMYAFGTGVARDDAIACSWWRKAADQGHPLAQLFLADRYERGVGVTKNMSEALVLFRKAADQGEPLAQFRLGAMYDVGKGVPQNYAEALKWYRKAADQGDARAQYSLGTMYVEGNGVTSNYVLAHMWFNLASAAQKADDKTRQLARNDRDRIAQSMTSQQVSQAQALADEWQPRNPDRFVPPEAVGSKDPKLIPIERKVVSTGTAFFVSQQGHLLTNHHVTEDCKSVNLRLPKQSSRGAILVARDSNNDLALLKSESRPDGVAVLSSRKRPQLGQSAIIFGFPLTGVLSSSGNLVTGTVSALSGLQDDSRLFQISAPVQPGNSGGPVMDASGAVIGVVVGKLNARAVEKATADIPQNVNFAIKGALAVGFLDSNGVDYLTDTQQSQQIPVEEIAKRAMRFTVLVECLK